MANKTEYSDDQKREMIAKYHELIKKGSKPKEAAKQFNLSVRTLHYNWPKQLGKPKRAYVKTPKIIDIPIQEETVFVFKGTMSALNKLIGGRLI